MPRYFSLAINDVVVISSNQWDYLQVLAQTNGDLVAAFKAYPCSRACKQEWVKDPIFWPAACALSAMYARSSRLNLEYVKDQIVAGMNCKDGKEPSASKIQHLNAAVRLLTPRAQAHTRIAMTPELLEVSFDEGLPQILENPTSQVILPPAKEVIDVEPLP